MRLKIEINIDMDKRGISFIKLTKSFMIMDPPAGPGPFPQTNKEALRLVIEELQEMVKDEQCYTCHNHYTPTGICQTLQEFKESHDTCKEWTPIIPMVK